MKQLNLWKNVWNLFLRYVMICVFMFMCIILISTSPSVLGPIFGVFYFIALIYYFWFTMKTEGGLDVNRVNIGQMPYFRWKGAVCALILVVPMMIINIIPNFFPDPTPEEYQAYFTGKTTVLTSDANFNRALRDASGKDGYIAEILFREDREITQILYVTSDGQKVRCDGTVTDPDKMYAIESVNEAGETVMTYYTANGELTDGQIAAFDECKNAIDDISTVMGSYPNWQKALAIVKTVLAMALQYFCAIFSGADNAVLASVVYCLCLLVLCVAAQVGYEMGYRNITLLRKKKPENDGKAGDTVVIQRAPVSQREEE